MNLIQKRKVVCLYYVNGSKKPNAGKPEIDKKALENRSSDPAGMQ